MKLYQLFGIFVIIQTILLYPIAKIFEFWLWFFFDKDILFWQDILLGFLTSAVAGINIVLFVIAFVLYMCGVQHPVF